MVTVHMSRIHTRKTSLPSEGRSSKRQWYVIAVKGAPDVVLNLCNRYQTMDNKASRPLDEEA